MKKYKLISLALTGSIILSAMLCGCGSKKNDQNSTAQSSVSSGTQGGDGIKLPDNGGFTTVQYQFSEDKYKTYYEIFPYSFYDSNADGIGDMNGIIQKLDYLNDGDTSTTTDLGVEGIWLMPIMESPSYHKYDVTNYMKVDEAYGTNDDFKKLLDECHKRHVDVIIDLVINHTALKHEWYQKAIEELKAGKTDGYVQYYNFEKDHTGGGWSKAGVDNWYYECQFYSGMPDLNLQNPKVREEIQNVVKYWLDMGVDGFRLDAVWWYESEKGNDASIADLKWLYDYAKTVKPDVYMVGECWKDTNTTLEFYKSGVDSFFNFFVQGATGKVNFTVNKKDALGYVQYLEKWQSQIKGNNPDAIDAQFLSNHDTARSAGYIRTLTKKRMNAALYMLAPGNPFMYYGEEICMTGSQNDPEKRKGMYWSSTDMTGYVKRIPDNTNNSLPDQSVEDAQKDENSLLNFYKRVIALRHQNPEIARGTLKAVELGDKSAAGYVTDYNGSKVMVIFNVSDKAAELNVPKDTFEIKEVRGYLLAAIGSDEEVKDAIPSSYADPMITVKDQTVKLPPYSAIVLK